MSKPRETGAPEAKTRFTAVDWRSMDDPVGCFENPHHGLKHNLADRFSIHIRPVLNSYASNPLKQTVAKAFKFSIRVLRAFYGRDLPKKEANDGR